MTLLTVLAADSSSNLGYRRAPQLRHSCPNSRTSITSPLQNKNNQLFRLSIMWNSWYLKHATCRAGSCICKRTPRHSRLRSKPYRNLANLRKQTSQRSLRIQVYTLGKAALQTRPAALPVNLIDWTSVFLPALSFSLCFTL